jgi:hypothetical protein
MFIPNPGSEFFHSGSRIHGQKYSGSRVKKILDPASASTFFFTLKTVSKLSEKLCSSRIPDPDFFLSRIQGSKERKNPKPVHYELPDSDPQALV